MTVRVLQGDCRDVLRTLPAASVHCVVTSPPYWGLRDYGIPPSIWGGDPDCAHEWGDTIAVNATNHTTKARWNHTRNGRDELQPPEKRVSWLRTEVKQGQFCQLCGAWSGVHGLEPTPTLYVQNAVEVFREVKRVLRADGTCWLNLGDCYASGTGPDGSNRGRHEAHQSGKAAPRIEAMGSAVQPNRAPIVGLKPKDLVGIPWRVAFALQEDGWWLRSDIIWAKRNCMPESIRDRPTRAHEYLFLLTKSQRYYYDATAIEEEGEIAAGTRAAKGSVERAKHANSRPPEYAVYTGKRNKRSVWFIATQPFPEAHFATFPPNLVEPCILAGTSEHGCCPACGAPWVRQTARVDSGRKQKMADGWDTGTGGHGTVHRNGRQKGETDVPVMVNTTTGWRPSCTCPAAPPVPATVLDPFGGAITTSLVANRLGRDAISIELNPDYVAMGARRIEKDAGMFADVQVTPCPAS